MPKIVEKLLRAGEKRQVKKLHGLAMQVNALEEDFVGLTDAELRAGGDEQPADHVARVVTLAAGQRGIGTPLADRRADIVDPYRRPVQVFHEMTEQIMGSLPQVVRALARP